MNDEEVLEERRRALKDSVDNFSEAGKPERETWALTQFLMNLGLDFKGEEVLSQRDDPPDIIFRGAKYEIKEVLDPGRRRHAEYKAALAKSLALTNLADLVEYIDIQDITPEQIGKLIFQKLPPLTSKYEPRLRATLNLLFDVNLVRHSLKLGPIPAPDLFSTFGWGSISMLVGWGALVLFADPNAPAFLRANVGRLMLREFR